MRIALLLVCAYLLTGCRSHSESEVKRVKVGDVELAYYARGKGEPLVMIMGFRGTMSAWDPALLKSLEKHYKLILFDNRGVGLSSDTNEDETTMSQMARDTAGLIKSLGYEKAHILGWSMGSRIAMSMALEHPEVVDRLILCAPNPGGSHQARRLTDAYAKLTSPHASRSDVLSRLFPHTQEGQRAKDAFVARVTEAARARSIPFDFEVNPQTVLRQVHALTLWDDDEEMLKRLQTIKCPTLVAGGLQDTLDSPENVKVVACQIPYAWSCYYPGAGHDFLSQCHEEFSNLLLVFLES